MQWKIAIHEDGSLDLSTAGELPVQIIEALHMQISLQSEFHDGQHIAIVEPWGGVWGLIGRYCWRTEKVNA